MKRIGISVFALSIFILGLTSCIKEVDTNETEQKQVTEFGLVIHGGAGYIYKGRYSDEEEKEYVDKLNEALTKGYEILNNGGSSVDAVEEVINIMEDSPLFNSGKGAVFASNGMNELDASIMNGKNLNAGAVAGVHHIKNPISLARKVMEESKHVMMVGDGAEKFAKQFDLEFVENKYFYTDGSWNALQGAKKSELEKKKEENPKTNKQVSLYSEFNDNKFGTVGCTALDKNGNLAAGTSTGGMTNKKYGRVGDSPIIGAGTYANNNTCAISATGHGEFFIRNVVTYDISALMEYKGMSLNDAAELVINDKLEKQEAKGGVISIDKYGNVAMKFNTPGMFRGYVLDNGKPVVKLYEEEAK